MAAREWKTSASFLFPWLFCSACAFSMPQMGTFLLLLWRDLGRLLTGGHGIASHRVLESGCGEDESQTDRIRANILQTHPGILRNKHKPSRMEIALLVAEPNASFAAVNQHYFILGQVPVLWYRCSGGELFCTRHKVLGAIVLWADLQHELRGGRDTGVRVNTASTQFAFIPFQEKRLSTGLRT